MRLNLALFDILHKLAGRSRLLDGVGFFFADTLTYFLVLGCIVFALRVRTARKKLFVMCEMLLAFLLARGILATAIHALFFQNRPFVALSFVPALLPHGAASFPSGHMSSLFAVAFVMLRFDRRWGSAYFVLSFCVGVGRVFAGVHWPFDILGGMAVGLIGGWLADRLVRKERAALFLSEQITSGGSV